MYAPATTLYLFISLGPFRWAARNKASGFHAGPFSSAGCLALLGLAAAQSGLRPVELVYRVERCNDRSFEMGSL